jgi:hypothetical protein
MAQIVKHPRTMQKFYVYDPNIPDELGGLRVYSDKDDKGNPKEGTKHVLATMHQMQYWIDQGLAGEKPVGEISDKAKKILAQITRGRSVDNDADPKRIPKYDKVTQSGSIAQAGRPGRVKSKKQKKDKKDKKQPQNHKRPPEPPKTAA